MACSLCSESDSEPDEEKENCRHQHIQHVLREEVVSIFISHGTAFSKDKTDLHGEDKNRTKHDPLHVKSVLGFFCVRFGHITLSNLFY